MVDIILDTLIDGIKLLPFLFIVFFVLEYIEHKVSIKNKKIIEKSGNYGPFIGAILGMFPQCGFSVAATNLFSARVITFISFFNRLSKNLSILALLLVANNICFI